MTPPIAIIHIAGRPEHDHRQRCVRCGEVLVDNSPESGWEMASTDGRGLGWWPIGYVTVAKGHPTHLAAGAAEDGAHCVPGGQQIH